ncbi:MAG: hypothetical protein GY811_03070 [Myxococcales bacterium]|nr:hypothetical protein [Myxococcales bacterium]
MSRTMMSRLRLRAIKCPGCGAQLAFDSSAATVTCDYCQQVSQVVGGPAKPQAPPPPVRQGVRVAVPPPQVRPKVQALPIVVGFAAILMITGASTAVVWNANRARSQQKPQAVSAVTAERPVPAAPIRRAQGSMPSIQKHRASSQSSKTNKKKKSRSSGHKTRKPNPYDVARSVKSAVTGCLTRDLSDAPLSGLVLLNDHIDGPGRRVSKREGECHRKRERPFQSDVSQ